MRYSSDGVNLYPTDEEASTVVIFVMSLYASDKANGFTWPLGLVWLYTPLLLVIISVGFQINAREIMFPALPELFATGAILSATSAAVTLKSKLSFLSSILYCPLKFPTYFFKPLFLIIPSWSAYKNEVLYLPFSLPPPKATE